MSWKDKILEGYIYSIGNDKLVALTGYGGAINFGEILEEKGFTDEMIQTSIEVHIKGKNIPLSALIVDNKGKEGEIS